MPQQQTATMAGFQVNLSPMAFHRWGAEYLVAAGALPSARFSPVRYFLTGMAAELTLKAFLLADGMSRTTLARRPYGHDLDRLLLEANRRNLGAYRTLDHNEEEQLHLLRAYYTMRSLEYFPLEAALQGFPHRPKLPELLKGLLAVSAAIEGRCTT